MPLCSTEHTQVYFVLQKQCLWAAIVQLDTLLHKMYCFCLIGPHQCSVALGGLATSTDDLMSCTCTCTTTCTSNVLPLSGVKVDVSRGTTGFNKSFRGGALTDFFLIYKVVSITLLSYQAHCTSMECWA